MYEPVDVVVHKSTLLQLRHTASEVGRTVSERVTLGVHWPLLDVHAEGDGHAQPYGDWQKFAHTGTMLAVRFPSHTVVNQVSDLEQRSVSA